MLGLILFIIILGVIVTIHEFGHFICAKLSGMYVYEFSIGMGKKIFGKKKQDGETEFCIRAFPLGGYVMIAGQDAEENESDIPKDRMMCNKSYLQRFLVLFAGPFNNFLLAFILLLFSAFIYGATVTTPIVGVVEEGYPAAEAGLEEGDLILAINDEKISNWDQALIKLVTIGEDNVKLEVKKVTGEITVYEITPLKVLDEDGNESYKLGIQTKYEKEYGFTKAIKYAVTRTISLFSSMVDTLKYLFTGKIGVNNLSGPVGIYSVINEQSKAGLEAILYLVAYLSINVGLINLLPLPAFDGGRIFLLLIEIITRKKISPRVESIVNTGSFLLLIALLIYVTFNDIINIIK